MEYAIEGGYHLYEADLRTVVAWLHYQAGELASARSEAERAHRLSAEMGYYWGRVDAEEVLARLQ